jgi:dTDP-4-dehydrorhamnose reductase/beta-phosphoglucomutase-like phosphatase (HAD superfamily)
MSVVIAGGSGLLGRNLTTYLETKNIQCYPTWSTRPILCKNSFQLDCTNYEKIEEFLQEVLPAVCVNCVAIRFPEKCEENWPLVKKVNIESAAFLAEICFKKGIRFIHISTDYVFDGTNPPYNPDSPTCPMNTYGISKLIAEKRVIAVNPDSLIVRVPVLYSSSQLSLAESSVTSIGKKVMNQIIKTEEDHYSIRRPLLAGDLCEYLFRNLYNREIKGIRHFYNPCDPLTKWMISSKIAQYLNLSHKHIRAINNFPARSTYRPWDTSLIGSDLDILNYSFKDIDEGIRYNFSKFHHPNFMKNPSDIFILLDLDGTLINSEDSHFSAYKQSFLEHGIDFSRSSFDKLINYGTIWRDLEDVDEETWECVHKRKNNLMLETINTMKIDWIQGGEEFLKMLLQYKINFAVVTNTTRDNVNCFKQKLPTLSLVEQWITREDYTNPKPDAEPYRLAIQKFSKDETFCVGFENTLGGYQSLRQITSRIYFLTDINFPYLSEIQKEDVIVIDSFKHFITLQ